MSRLQSPLRPFCRWTRNSVPKFVAQKSNVTRIATVPNVALGSTRASIPDSDALGPKLISDALGPKRISYEAATADHYGVHVLLGFDGLLNMQ
jgi:hypothetical protein